ncbi:MULTISPECIES: hypothetical protein [Streptomyces]|uniref:hypothetical protein n=1 Tax=Streptomyces TaxID=1883 RepID=UPI0022495D10|nr:hypothetical protein [Streptomyces sp. JHD 1]MCX2968222.1 hypothetical protein [Streptomyces sp. JHD 1]
MAQHFTADELAADATELSEVAREALGRRLAGLRRDALVQALGRLRGPHRVALYARVEGEADPAPALAAAEAFAVARGWVVTSYHVDRCGGAAYLDHRPGWRELCGRIRRGHAQGVVADHRDAVSPLDAVYESALKRLGEVLAFLALPPGGDLPRSTPPHRVVQALAGPAPREGG